MNEWQEAQDYLNGSMVIEFDGKTIPVQAYLDRAERAERLARMVRGDLYDSLRGETLPGSGRPKQRQERTYTEYARRMVRIESYASQVEETGRIEYHPSAPSHVEHAEKFLELFEKFFPNA